MFRYFVLLILTIFCTCASGQILGHKEVILDALLNKIKRPNSKVYLIRVKDFDNFESLSGLKIVRQLAHELYIVRETKGQIMFDREATPVNDMYKASDGLLLHWLNQDKSKVKIILKTTSTDNLSKVKKYGSILSSNGSYVTMMVSSKYLPELLSSTTIEFADIWRRPYEELSINNNDLSTNQISTLHAFYPATKGLGMIVSVKENKYDVNDIDLLGRTIFSASEHSVMSGHATTMATLIGGNGTSYKTGLGVAPQVTLTSSDFNQLLPDNISSLKMNQISIQNHSYGTGIENYYGIEAHEYDQQVYQTDTLLHIFSAGNIGTSTPILGLYTGVKNHANLTGTFKQAKNVLVVGGTNREYIVESLSSKGPSYDGRVKPEIVAYGEDGTSGAAALTSGVVCLLKQKYRDKYYQAPSAALLKSILVNSATDIGKPHVDYDSGFGALNAYQAMKTIEESRFKSGAISDGQDISYPIQIGEGIKEFKISLAWNDLPTNINAPQALVNDLDIWIEDSAGNKILPWVLNHSPFSEAILAAAIRNKDHLNNVEQVTLDYPSAGEYTIHIYGSQVTKGLQQFHFSYQSTPADYFEWHFPAKDDQLLASANLYLRYDNTFNSTGTLSVSFDNGLHWEVITSSVPANSSFFSWKTPNVFTQALLKMTINGQEFISQPFSISKPVDFNVGYDCEDGVLLYWKKQAQSTGYTIYTIKDDRLQAIAATTDTLIQISKEKSSQSDYFAVSAKKNTLEGIKGYTLNIKEQGVGCYVQSLLTDVGSHVITLTLRVGTIVGLSGTIKYEKLVGKNTFITLGASTLNNSLVYVFTDTQPKSGLQYYRAVLETVQGKRIISDMVSAVYLSESEFVFFPNPANEQFSVVSGTLAEYELSIYTMEGRKVSKYALNSLQQDFSISQLPVGIYLCKVTLANRVVYETKLIKI